MNTSLTNLCLSLYFLLWLRDNTAISAFVFGLVGVFTRLRIASPSDSELISCISLDGFNYFMSNKDRLDLGMLLCCVF